MWTKVKVQKFYGNNVKQYGVPEYKNSLTLGHGHGAGGYPITKVDHMTS